jgi:CRP-like cAMP-binding protein
MRTSPPTKTGNRLLDLLPSESLQRLRPYLEPVDLITGQPANTGEYVYFPTAGMISVLAMMEDGAAVEVGIVGREGMHSVVALLNEDTPLQNAMVQLSGRALRLGTALLRQEMQANAPVQKLMLRYVQAVLLF